MSSNTNTCSGCEPVFQPNQMAHMDIGGCLYKDYNCNIREETDEQKLKSLKDEDFPIQCPVCQDDIYNDNYAITRDCIHVFHKECLTLLVNLITTCPMCSDPTYLDVCCISSKPQDKNDKLDRYKKMLWENEQKKNEEDDEEEDDELDEVEENEKNYITPPSTPSYNKTQNKGFISKYQLMQCDEEERKYCKYYDDEEEEKKVQPDDEADDESNYYYNNTYYNTEYFDNNEVEEEEKDINTLFEPPFKVIINDEKEKETEKDEHTCPICYEEITTTNIAITECNHMFHTSCLLKAVERNVDCPLCRSVLLYEEIPDDEIPDDEIDDEDDNDDSENSDDEYTDDDDDNVEHPIDEEQSIVTINQLTQKLQNMGYTPEDFILLYVKDLHLKPSQSNRTVEYLDELDNNIDKILDGTITMGHRDTRSYADVV